MTERDTLARQATTAVSPGETASPRARLHGITLCCAHSVEALVQEVARNLEGLGFEARVASGAEAREALRGRDRDPVRPTIYVVCVQGQLRETVLKPLRQALADQGGPNEHLFVAVLDTALPLAMVGQIRRFAETLEQGQRRPRLRGKELEAKELSERRQWREEMGGDHRFRSETQRYRALRVETGRQEPIRPPEDVREATRVSGTSKYRAIALATTGEDPAEQDAANDGEAPLGDGAGAGSGSTPGLETKVVREPRVLRTQASRPPPARPLPAVPTRASAAARWLVWAGIGAGVIAVGMVLGTGRREGDARGVRVAGLATGAAAVDEGATREGGDAEAREREVVDAQAREGAEARESEVVDAQAREGAEAREREIVDAQADEAADAQANGAADADASEGAGMRAREAVDEASPDLVARSHGIPPAPPYQEPVPDTELRRALAPALERRSVFETEELYVTLRQGEATHWDEARRRCVGHREGTVGPWRLPFRRELKLLGAIGKLQPGRYWSRSSDPSTPDLAVVYDTAAKTLDPASKTETTAEVICVLRKDADDRAP